MVHAGKGGESNASFQEKPMLPATHNKFLVAAEENGKQAIRGLPGFLTGDDMQVVGGVGGGELGREEGGVKYLISIESHVACHHGKLLVVAGEVDSR